MAEAALKASDRPAAFHVVDREGVAEIFEADAVFEALLGGEPSVLARLSPPIVQLSAGEVKGRLSGVLVFQKEFKGKDGHGGKLEGALSSFRFRVPDEERPFLKVYVAMADAEGTCEIRRIPLTPERDLRRVEGTLSEVQAGGDGSGSSPDENEEDYIWVTLEEEGPVVDAMSRIRETYPNALHVEQQAQVDGSSLSGLASDLEAQSEEEVFEEFAAHATGNESLSEGHQEVLEEAIGRLEEEERGA